MAPARSQHFAAPLRRPGSADAWQTRPQRRKARPRGQRQTRRSLRSGAGFDPLASGRYAPQRSPAVGAGCAVRWWYETSRCSVCSFWCGHRRFGGSLAIDDGGHSGAEASMDEARGGRRWCRYLPGLDVSAQEDGSALPLGGAPAGKPAVSGQGPLKDDLDDGACRLRCDGHTAQEQTEPQWSEEKIQ
jgi:hypothetical protein